VTPSIRRYLSKPFRECFQKTCVENSKCTYWAIQYGVHVSDMGQILNEWRVSGPILRDIRKSIARWLVCWSKFNKRTLRKEKRATRQAWTRNPKPPHFQHVSLMGLTEAQCSSTLHKSQNRGCPLSHVSNGSLLPSCMGRRGLSITKEINTISNTIYSTLRESRPP